MTGYIKNLYISTLKREGNGETDLSNHSPNDDFSTEQNQDPANNSGVLWKTAAGLTSGVYSVGAGAVGLGAGAVKWAAETGYNVGSGVVTSATGVASGVVQRAALCRKKDKFE